MNAEEFLEVVLPSDGHYCLFGLKDKKPISRFVSTIGGVVEGARRLSEHKADAFYALATFEEVAKGRVGGNAKLVKSLWLDLDCGKNKPYPTTKEGLRALKQFVKDFNLPSPWLIGSGFGVHVYWPLTEAVSPAEWHPLATALKSACQKSNLDVDPVPTADIARVLRVPGTFHYKSDPRKVVILKEGAISSLEKLKELLPEGEAAPPMPVFKKLDDVTERILNSGYRSSFQLILKKSQQGVGCPQLLNMVSSPEGVSEPSWRAGLSIVWRCIGGEKNVYRFSKHYKGYTTKETLEKADNTLGPLSCIKFKEYGHSELCDKCTNWGKITSPIVLGREFVPREESTALVVPPPKNETPAEEYTPPFPYRRGEDGKIFRLEKDEHGNDKPILVYEHDLYLTKRVMDPQYGECFVMKHKLPKDDIREFIVPLKVAHAPDKFKEVLGSQGVAADVKRWAGIFMYTTAFVKELQQKYAAQAARTSFGWCDDGKNFLVGSTLYTKNGPEYSPPSSYIKDIVPFMQPKGDLTIWRDTVKEIIKGSPERTFAFLLGLATPLMKWTHLGGCTVGFVSEDSGTGKTAVLQAANSIWGHPENLMLKQGDTEQATYHFLGIVNSMAATIDEMTLSTTEFISRFVYTVSQGRGRHRLQGSVNAMRINVTDWNSIVLATGNAFWMDKLGAYKARSEAEMMRMLEVQLTTPLANGKKLIVKLSENHGVAAGVYATWLVKNTHRFGDLVDKVTDRVGARSKQMNRERFWVGIVAISFIAGEAANDLFDLDINMEEFEQWVYDLLGSSREEVDRHQIRAEDAMGNFLNEKYSSLLVMDTSVNDPIHGYVRKQAFGGIVARYERNSRHLYVSKSAIRDYCAERQLSFNNMLTKDMGMIFNGFKRIRMASKAGIDGGGGPPIEVLDFSITGEEGDYMLNIDD